MKFNKEKIVPTNDEMWPEGAYMIHKENLEFGDEYLILMEGQDDDVYEYLTTIGIE